MFNPPVITVDACCVHRLRPLRVQWRILLTLRHCVMIITCFLYLQAQLVPAPLLPFLAALLLLTFGPHVHLF